MKTKMLHHSVMMYVSSFWHDLSLEQMLVHTDPEAFLQVSLTPSVIDGATIGCVDSCHFEQK